MRSRRVKGGRMFLFTRAGRFAPGSIRDAMGFVRAVTEKVQQETGLDIQAWASTMSPEQGTTVWAAFVEDLEHLEEANDKLATSDSYIDLVQGSAQLAVGRSRPRRRGRSTSRRRERERPTAS